MKLETKVGIFFFAAIAILGLLIIRTEKMVVFGKKNTNQYAMDFEQVAGLSVQSQVRVAGVKVGTVDEIRLEGGKARVIIGLPTDVPVYADASVQLSSLGILGEKYVDLNQGKPAAGLMAKNGVIPSRQGPSLDDLMETLASIGKDVKGITGALNESIGGEEGQQKLDEIVDNIRVLTGEFRSMAQENHGAINATMANAQAISAELRERLPRMAQQFENLARNLNEMVADGRPEMKGMMSDVRKLAQNFQSTSENLRLITDKINRGEGTIGKLLNDEATVKKINQAVDNVNEMMGGLKAMELRLDMSAARWSKRGDGQSGLSIELAPQKDYWYTLGVNATPDGKIKETTTTTSTTPGTPVTVKKVETDKSFTVSAEFAKRLGDHVVVSGGIVESKGGAGVEYRALDDRLRVGALAYDFSKREGKQNPRYRLTTSYEIWRGMYAQAGVQDIANPELRTFFVGGGIRWKDEDMKKLLGLAGSAVK
ncbi:MAG TPA: MlaD family protein [Holophaga sp.]|nr:MlaD family protein [Holophaga sp.]HPS68265.1 MlaD family protein [Holophaga sp.]